MTPNDPQVREVVARVLANDPATKPHALADAVLAALRGIGWGPVAMLERKVKDIADWHESDCDDPECSMCAVIWCPFGDPLHTHHDGCPSCSLHEDEALRAAGEEQ